MQSPRGGIPNCRLPARPPKPSHLSSQTAKASGCFNIKHPPPSQSPPAVSCNCNLMVNPCDEYDVPKCGQEHVFTNVSVFCI